MIGNRADWAFVAFQHIDDRRRAGRQDRAAPAPRPERADRGEGEKRCVDRQDRAMGGQIIGRDAGRGRDQHAVGDQFLQPHIGHRR